MSGIFEQALALGEVGDDWTSNAAYFEYSRAADPVGDGVISEIFPSARFGAELYAGGPTRIVPLDISGVLGVPSPATSPALCANFVRICAGEAVEPEVNASSQLWHVISGKGTSTTSGRKLRWGTGDFITLPAGCLPRHLAEEDSTLYWVHDEPLMTYLGATATEPRFAPTHYLASQARRCLEEVRAEAEEASRSRISVLLANRALDQTLTVTHVLWAMFGILPRGQVQPPHRHQSVALDLIIDCQPGCYSLLGDLDEHNKLVRVERVEWEPGAAFITPPGRWHSHHNESGADAHLIPIQDAGLQTYLRTLDIRFMSKRQTEESLGSLSSLA